MGGPRYSKLRFGSVRPSGWLRGTMSEALREGFVGHLDRIVPALVLEDDLYGRDRLAPGAARKDLGTASQDDDWGIQYQWWNSETQSNWWDGFARHALLLGDLEALERLSAEVERKLSTQGEDGYLGIYAPGLRFASRGENGELWALASLGRVLLAWYEALDDQRVLEALEEAVGLVMRTFPAGASAPFDLGPSFAGAAHGLMLTDVLFRLHELTGRKDYLDYAAFLFRDYGLHGPHEDDILPARLLDPGEWFHGHSVHTYEQLRALLVARKAALARGPDGEGEALLLDRALASYLRRLEASTCPSGAAIGDEWIPPSGSDPAATGYEYCSLQELLDSLCLYMREGGGLSWGDRVESLLYNAALGARHPEGDSIAYLKTDDCDALEGEGPTHGEGGAMPASGGPPQVRYKYSPAHQDAAVCCVPNAGRIMPTFVASAWLGVELDGRQGFALALYCPSRLEAELGGTALALEVETEYPWTLSALLRFSLGKPLSFPLVLRKPAWARGMKVESGSARLTDLGEALLLVDEWTDGRTIAVSFEAPVEEVKDERGRVHVRRGPLVYALPVPAREETGRVYLPGFRDRRYTALSLGHRRLALAQGTAQPVGPAPLGAFLHGRNLPRIAARLVDGAGGESLEAELYPMGATILRQVTFPLAPS